MNKKEPRSTIAQKSTRPVGHAVLVQCYDGILCQLVDMWADINSVKNGYRRIAYTPLKTNSSILR